MCGSEKTAHKLDTTAFRMREKTEERKKEKQKDADMKTEKDDLLPLPFFIRVSLLPPHESDSQKKKK